MRAVVFWLLLLLLLLSMDRPVWYRIGRCVLWLFWSAVYAWGLPKNVWEAEMFINRGEVR